MVLNKSADDIMLEARFTSLQASAQQQASILFDYIRSEIPSQINLNFIDAHIAAFRHFAYQAKEESRRPGG
jgi:hypothetical protein